MTKLLLPILVYPRSAAVPLWTFENSLKVLFEPTSKVAFSPLNLRSGVSSPITQNEKNELSDPNLLGPFITTCAFKTQLGPSSTSGPTTE